MVNNSGTGHCNPSQISNQSSLLSRSPINSNSQYQQFQSHSHTMSTSPGAFAVVSRNSNFLTGNPGGFRPHQPLGNTMMNGHQNFESRGNPRFHSPNSQNPVMTSSVSSQYNGVGNAVNINSAATTTDTSSCATSTSLSSSSYGFQSSHAMPNYTTSGNGNYTGWANSGNHKQRLPVANSTMSNGLIEQPYSSAVSSIGAAAAAANLSSLANVSSCVNENLESTHSPAAYNNNSQSSIRTQQQLPYHTGGSSAFSSTVPPGPGSYTPNHVMSTSENSSSRFNHVSSDSHIFYN